ncbi:MAG: leucyl aminopeptidase family protein [Pseudomonadota bacterium]
MNEQIAPSPAPTLLSVPKLAWDDLNSQFDGLLVLSPGVSTGLHEDLDSWLETTAELDRSIGKLPRLLIGQGWPGSRVAHVPLLELNNDYADVRSVAEAAGEGAQMLIDAGASRLLLCLPPLKNVTSKLTWKRYRFAAEVAYTGVCQRIWEPLEGRRHNQENTGALSALGIHAPGMMLDTKRATAVEQGRSLARDLAGTEPEIMAPPGFADYCQSVFADSPVACSVESDVDKLRVEYPLLAAVARASLPVERHHPRVIRLEYKAPQARRTLFLVGKAVTYDTGGADLKVGGKMAGMSRDKGGGAAAAGFMKAVAELAPSDLNVVTLIGAVRNSIDAEAYVTDEVVTSRSGKRVRIGNTDAEGRLVMADLLAQAREEAVCATSPALHTLATLTGHAALALGPYTALLENGPAFERALGSEIEGSGTLWGDPGQVMRLRREDWQQNKARSSAEDLVSSPPGPSVTVPRGHQFPAAFLIAVSGLDAHGSDSESPLPFCHLDIAGSACEGGDWQFGKPTAAPLMALVGAYLAGGQMACSDPDE